MSRSSRFTALALSALVVDVSASASAAGVCPSYPVGVHGLVVDGHRVLVATSSEEILFTDFESRLIAADDAELQSRLGLMKELGQRGRATVSHASGLKKLSECILGGRVFVSVAMPAPN